MTSQSDVYTSNAWLAVGNFKGFNDINTLVDTGRCPEVLDKLAKAPTGVGKRAVEQVIITHNHYDHIGMLAQLIERYCPRVYAFSPNVPGVTDILQDGQILKMADRKFLVLNAPGHSSDSLFLYCQDDSILFSGDNPVHVATEDSYNEQFIDALRYLAKRSVKTVYPGHGPPIHAESYSLLGQCC